MGFGGLRGQAEWSRNEKGIKEDFDRCVKTVAGGGWVYQCSRKRGHGKDGLYCKQHAKMIGGK